MKTMQKCLVFSAFLLPSIAIAEAPFCVYSSGLPQCFYYDINTCRNAASSMNGMCAPNNQPQQQTTPQPAQPTVKLATPNIYQSMTQGMEAGRRARQERDEYDARMRLYEAQTAAANAQLQAPAKTVDWGAVADGVMAARGQAIVVYSCDGIVTDIPRPGCVVLRIEPEPGN